MEVKKKYKFLFIALSIVSLGTIATLSTLLALKSCSTNHVETTVLKYTSNFTKTTAQSLAPTVLVPSENELVLEEGAETTKEYICTPLNTEEVVKYLQNHKVDAKFDQQNVQPVTTNNCYEMTSTFIKNNFTSQFLINTFVNGLMQCDLRSFLESDKFTVHFGDSKNLETEIIIVKENENNFSVTKIFENDIQEKISINKNSSNTEFFCKRKQSHNFADFSSQNYNQHHVITNDNTNLHILIDENETKYIDSTFLMYLGDTYYENIKNGLLTSSDIIENFKRGFPTSISSFD
jgi:hypothetical protein